MGIKSGGIPRVFWKKKAHRYLISANSFLYPFNNVNIMREIFSFGKKKIMAMNYTRYIALPKDWLRFVRLDAGDEVIIELTEDGSLLIKPLKWDDEV